MSSFVKITYDRNRLFSIGKFWLIFITCWVVGNAVSIVIAGHSSDLTNQGFWFRIAILGIPVILMILLPLSFSPFIRPLSQSKKDLFTHGGIVILFSSLISTAIIYFSINSSWYPFEIENRVKTISTMIALCLLANSAVCLSRILITKDKNS